jgi:hypothetical protein
MKITRIGDYTGPVVMTVGTWDPFSSESERLLAQLRRTAARLRLGSAVAVLDPSPRVFVVGENQHPLFHNSEARVELLRRSGIDLVVHVAFEPGDLYGTAADFFDAVCPHVEIREFWLRNKQDLGRNARGSQLAVTLVCRARGIHFRILPPDPGTADASAARILLGRGDVEGAARRAGCPPRFHRPAGGRLSLAWAPGLYQALPLDGAGAPAGDPLAVTLRPGGDGMATLEWTARMGEALAFVAGPCSGLEAELPPVPREAPEPVPALPANHPMAHVVSGVS